MRRLSIYVGNLLLIFIAFSFSRGNVVLLVEEELYKRYGNEVKLKEAYVYPPNVTLKEGDVKLYVREGYPEGSAIIKSGNISVRVRFKLLWRRELPVAVVNISRGEVLDSTKVKWSMVYTEENPRDFISKGDILEDFVAIKPIKSGDYIRKRFLRRRYLVKRGDTVTVIYRSGNIYITYEAEAMENGYRGSFIRLKVPSSGKVIKGKVVGEGKVEVR